MTNRTNSKPVNNTQSSGRQIKKYEPNYVRLGMEPVIRAASPNDFKRSNKPLKPRTPEPSVRKQSVPSSDSQRIFIPKSTNVQSGQNRAHVWYPSEQDNEGDAEEYINSDISYDEVEDLDNSENLPQEDFNDPTDINQYNLSSIEQEQYFIIIDGKITCIADSLGEIEELVESIMFDPKSPYVGISVDVISVFQKLNLKFGISVKK